MKQWRWFPEWCGAFFGATLDFTTWKIGFGWWSCLQIFENRMVIYLFLGPIEFSFSFRKE